MKYIFVLVYLTGDENDYLSLAIKDGAVSLSINIGNGRLDTGIRNRVIRFDDDVWHNVIITRVAEQVMNTTDTLLYRRRKITAINH